VTPSSLDKSDFVVGEMVDGFLKKIRIRNEVGVENENEITVGSFHPIFESASFKAGTVSAVNAFCVKAPFAKAGCSGAGNFNSLVSRVIKNLDFHLFLRVVEGRNGLEKAVNNVHFIENRKLNRDERHGFELASRHGAFTAVLEVEIDNRQAMAPVTGKGKKNCRVKTEPDPG
jgi:hypothetical protein